MNCFLVIFFVQFVFGGVLSIGSVPVIVGSAVIGGSYYYSGTIGKHVIQKYIDEDVVPFNSSENILKMARVGDLIEVDRQGLFFNHWAIFIGNGRVANPFVLENIQITEIYNTTRALILRESLIEMVGSDLCRINNKPRSTKNRGIKPRTVNEILETVEKFKNTGFDYNMFESNCEHIVTEFKFGVAFSDQAEAVIGIANQTLKKVNDLLTLWCDASLAASAASLGGVHKIIEIMINEDVGQFLSSNLILQEVKLYDIIEIKRSGYSHYALYVGEGYVQHLSHDYNLFKTVRETRVGAIVREKLLDVTGRDLCRVNNKKRSSKKRKLVPQDPKIIKTYVDALENKKLEYSIYSYNCEHIVTQWKFGKAFSDQVDAVEKAAVELGKMTAALLFSYYTGQPMPKQFK